MHRKVMLLMLIFIIIVMLTSYYDANEVDDMTYVLTIGIDRGVTVDSADSADSCNVNTGLHYTLSHLDLKKSSRRIIYRVLIYVEI